MTGSWLCAQGSQRQKEIEKLSFKEQYLRGLCELAHIEDCVEQWQHRAEQDIGLTEYLGLTGEEHKTFLCGGRGRSCRPVGATAGENKGLYFINFNWTKRTRSHLLSRILQR